MQPDRVLDDGLDVADPGALLMTNQALPPIAGREQEILALEIYRTLLSNNQAITEGIYKAITMAY
jgi:hypothetical protein